MGEMKFPVHMLNKPSVLKDYKFVRGSEVTVYRIVDIADGMGTLKEVDRYQI